MMTYSKNAEMFTSGFEGFTFAAVHHPEDPPNVWTMGFGSTYWDGAPVKQGMTCTRDAAMFQLRRGLNIAAQCVSSTVHVSLTQNEFDACVDFAYNLGCGRWVSSTARARLNDGDYHGAAAAFEMWDRAGGKVLAGLLRRRKAEEALFNA